MATYKIVNNTLVTMNDLGDVVSSEPIESTQELVAANAKVQQAYTTTPTWNITTNSFDQQKTQSLVSDGIGLADTFAPAIGQSGSPTFDYRNFDVGSLNTPYRGITDFSNMNDPKTSYGGPRKGLADSVSPLTTDQKLKQQAQTDLNKQNDFSNNLGLANIALSGVLAGGSFLNDRKRNKILQQSEDRKNADVEYARNQTNQFSRNARG